jgi:hypothetical protein
MALAGGNCIRLAMAVCFLSGAPMELRTIVRVALLCGMAFLPVCGASPQTDAPKLPVVDGQMGLCKADILVKDGDGKPIEKAKISVLVKTGFMGMKKTELEATTNSEGKARFEGLPPDTREPLEFVIKSGTVYTTVKDDPSNTCVTVLNVTMRVR